MKNTTNNMYFFHLNISSLCFYIEELTTLISEHKCQLKLDKAPLNSVQIPGYNFEFPPTEYNNGGTVLYIKKD